MSMIFQADKSLNIPNVLTIGRIIAVPIFVMFFYLPFEWSYMASAIIFGAAGITDWFDGYLARKLKQSTKVGAFLDPVADKLMVVVSLVLLVEAHANTWIAVAAIIIIAREVAISALREWMSDTGNKATVAVSYVGKVKTLAQMVAITGLLSGPPDYSSYFVLASYSLLYVSVVLTIWSMFIYLKAAWPVLTSGE